LTGPAPFRDDLESLRAEVAKLRADLESRVQFYQLCKQIIDVVKIVATIAVCAVPLLVIVRMIQAMAGKDTRFTADVRITLAVTALISIAWGATAIQSHRRKDKILRLRDRADTLERQLLEIYKLQIPQQSTEFEPRTTAKDVQHDG
jgi:hypothetical protein